MVTLDETKKKSKYRDYGANPKSQELKEQTIELLKQLQLATGSRRDRIRAQLVQLNEGLVERYANMFWKISGEPFEDLKQIGLIGLLKAIDRIDISRGVAFSSYSAPFIRGEITHYLRDKGSAIRIPRRYIDVKSKIEKFKAQGLSDSEIEQKLKWHPGELKDAQIALSGSMLSSTDAFELDCFESRLKVSNLKHPDTILELNESGFFNATEICKSEGKKFKRFWEKTSIKRRIKDLEKVAKSDLFIIQRGRNGGAFLHRSIAPEFLAWVNAAKYKPILQEMLINNLEEIYGKNDD